MVGRSAPERAPPPEKKGIAAGEAVEEWGGSGLADLAGSLCE
jgi:hypothetical protein